MVCSFSDISILDMFYKLVRKLLQCFKWEACLEKKGSISEVNEWKRRLTLRTHGYQPSALTCTTLSPVIVTIYFIFESLPLMKATVCS